MITRENIIELASKQGIACGKAVTLSDAECDELEHIAKGKPTLSEDEFGRMFLLLRRRLAWQEVDRGEIPAPLLAFFDAKVGRDMDMLSLARTIGHDIRSACDACTCRC